MAQRRFGRSGKKSGFTLTELMVVLAIIGIVAAIAIPTAIHYIRLAQFRANEENAKSVYLGAETALTYYRSSGQWEEFCRELKKEGVGALNEDFDAADKRHGRIYGITLDPGTYGTDTDNLVYRLLDRISYDKDFLNAAITIEIDIATGEVYSAFYGTKCQGLYYGDKGGGDSDGKLNLYDREYESRRKRLLGYYSAEDVVNVVELESRKLKVTSVSLVNGETLALHWSSNSSHYNLDVAYDIQFFRDDNKQELFRVNVDLGKIYGGTEGELLANGTREFYTDLELALPGKTESEKYKFPVSVKDGELTLTLDAMMSAQLLEKLNDTAITEGERKGLEKTSSVSITRLKELSTELKTALEASTDIYASITASSNNKYPEEYRKSNASSSNSANLLYADGAKMVSGSEGTPQTLQAGISKFRHLSNIRYAGENAEFTLSSGSMDWNAAGCGLYGISKENGQEDGVLQPKWTEHTREKTLAFPTIPKLTDKQSLKGTSGLFSAGSAIANLYLDETSVSGEKAAYLGLFGEVEGSLSDFTLADPRLVYQEEQKAPAVGTAGAGSKMRLSGVGLLAGKSAGKLENIKVEAAVDKEKPTLLVKLGDHPAGNETEGQTEDRPAGIGGLVGVLVMNADSVFEGMEMSGYVEGMILGAEEDKREAEEAGKNPGAENRNEKNLGIGGLAGYADLTKSTKANSVIKDCKNHADVYGNGYTGGIAGHMAGRYERKDSETGSTGTTETRAELVNCSNDGLVLRYQEETLGVPSGTDANKEAMYFGGILGYGKQVEMESCSSTPGASTDYTYDFDEPDPEKKAALRRELRKGWYVGGILGFGDQCMLEGCSTGKNGYVLGDRYVGGIVGALHGFGETTGTSTGNDTMIQGGTEATVNASYVIGNDYVGGIVGENRKNEVKLCVNNGVAVGYGNYIGGIAGTNAENAKINNCASYISDYDNSVYDKIVNDWKASGSFVGGLAGYNNAVIKFDGENQLDTKSVFSIVVGQDYVGGVVGFNDVDGTLEVDYALMGGRIHAFGDCAGGLIGLNASTQLLGRELEVKPGSVAGRYCVGGGIGANVVYLDQDTTMSQMRVNNTLGSVNGEAFCGGLIGYQRNAGTVDHAGEATELLAFLTNADGKIEEEKKGQLTPVLSANGLPSLTGNTEIKESSNIFTISPSDENEMLLANNMPINGDVYVGGVVGYGEKNSKLAIRNCRNEGYVSKKTDKKSLVYLQDLLGYIEKGNIIAPDSPVDVVGGIISVCLEGQEIDHCNSTGAMNGFAGIGGVVGLNAGTIQNCELESNFGNLDQSFVGGVAAFNVGTIQGNQVGSNTSVCVISGSHTVGGIVSCNLEGGQIIDNTANCNVTANGDGAGGIAAQNQGTVQVSADSGASERRITSSGGRNVGGIVGWNEGKGTISVEASGDNKDNEVIVVGEKVTVEGKDCVGGIIGRNDGKIEVAASGSKPTLVAQAKQVHAFDGAAGGIAGMSEGGLENAANRSLSVTADKGDAGGIVAVNSEKSALTNCKNYGPVSNSQGYAGGICAQNQGMIESCQVVGGTKDPLVIYSLRAGKECSGAVCALNLGTINNCGLSGSIKFDGNSSVFGAIAGYNEGTIRNITLTTSVKFPAISTSKNQLTVGGIAGRNQGTIDDVKSNFAFEGFSNYQYLGGIVGENLMVSQEDGTENGAEKRGLISNCSYQGTIADAGSSNGSCYGGIAGKNAGDLFGCEIGQITMDIQGIYAANSSNTAEQKEAYSAHIGGVAGKNEESGIIVKCILKDDSNSSITVANGMLGGVAGFNKGTIVYSGGAVTANIMTEDATGLVDPVAIKAAGDVTGIAVPGTTVDVTGAQVVLKPGEEKSNKVALEKLLGAVNKGGIKADADYVTWGGNNIENLNYSVSKNNVAKGRMRMIVSNGNLGGIAAYNAPRGRLSYCATGNWFLNNKSDALGVGTGGIIGMNESEYDLRYLVNQAFVGRQLSSTNTDRFAGGIIGNQINSTSEGWTIEKCLNYGMIYCYNAHYSGGIIGQWSGTGGTIEGCVNYGNLQTTFGAGWVGASGGIVAQLYHASENNEYNIVSCGNYGSIYGKNGKQISESASDSAGILGNITNYYVDDAKKGQNYTIRVLDCVNGPGVEIYSYSMASGIVGFLSCDYGLKNNTPTDEAQRVIGDSTANTTLIIERCRNFAPILSGKNFAAGIFGDRYQAVTGKENLEQSAENTELRDCFSVRATYKNDDPVVSLRATNGSTELKGTNTGRNYFFEYSTSYQWSSFLYMLNNIPNKGSITEEKWVDLSGGGGIQRANSHRLYCIKDGDRLFAVALRIDKTLDRNCKFDSNHKYIYNNRQEIVADVICELDKNEYKYVVENKTEPGITTVGSTWCDLVRTSYLYRNLEGVIIPAADPKRLQAPGSVTATISNGSINLKVDNPNRDPLRYEVEVTIGGNKYYSYIYEENASVQLPKDTEGGNVEVKVRAVSMYDDVQPSAWTEGTTLGAFTVLPAPDVRVELVADGGKYQYQVRLDNLADYPVEGGWEVNGTLTNGTTITLSREKTTARINGIGTNSQQMVLQAISSDGNKYIPSAQISVPLILPNYIPSVSLSQAKPSVTVTGTTLDDLAVQVELDARGSGVIDYPPIYRAELVGTWNGEGVNQGKEVVFAYTDILVAANGQSTAALSNFGKHSKDDLKYGSGFKVRVWYAQPGLGPVYTYFDLDANADGSAPASSEGEVLTYLDTVTGENGTFTYIGTPVWQNNNNTFANYRKAFDNVFTLLKPPVLGEMTSTDPKTQELEYTFRWESGQGAANAAYQVSLVGITDNNDRVTIDTSKAYTDNTKEEMTISAEDWNFKGVEITVTQVGTNSGTPTIGVPASQTYTVKGRLAQPSQPSAMLVNNNELVYRIQWSGLSPEPVDCAGYDVYWKEGQADAVLLGTVPKGENGIYTLETDLEDFAGKSGQIYVVAKASGTSARYVDSKAGVSYGLTVPSRISEPEVTWTLGWEENGFKTVDEFERSGLLVSLKPDANSKPQAGSAYVLKAEIYEDEAAANAGTGLIASYPADGTPIQMNYNRTGEYSLNLSGLSAEYAGKYIKLSARISSGGGQVSSPWVEEIAKLPDLKLNEPKVSSRTVTQQVLADIMNPGTGENPRQETWTVHRNEWIWVEAPYGNTYHVTIEEKSDGINPGKTHTLRIQRTENGDGDPQLQLQKWVKNESASGGTWQNVANMSTEDGIWRWQLQDYQQTVSSPYSAESVFVGRTTFLTELRAEYQADTNTFNFALLLPDVESLYDLNNVRKDGKNITANVTFISDRMEGEATENGYRQSDETKITIP